VALVDRVTDRLSDEMRRDGNTLEAVAVQDLAPAVRVTRIGKRLVDVEVIAPAGELESVEAPGGGLAGELLQR